MKKLATLSILLFAVGCGQVKYIAIETEKTVTVHDTTYLHRVDTLVQVPEVSIADYIDLTDTLHLEAPYASMSAWVDSTSNTLKGTLKQSGKMPVQIVEKERVVYRDSLVTQEIPVEVPIEKIVKVVPPIYKWALRVMAVLILAAIAYALLKLKGWL